MCNVLRPHTKKGNCPFSDMRANINLNCFFLECEKAKDK